MSRERPSRHGAIVGQAIAQLAAAAPIPPETCATCAFREGSYPNMSAATALVALKCAVGADTDAFACHHGLNDGQPTRMCEGFLAAKLVPREEAERIIENMRLQLDAAPAGPDPIREATDAWLAEVDPEGKLDDYVRARQWAKAKCVLAPTPAAPTRLLVQSEAGFEAVEVPE